MTLAYYAKQHFFLPQLYQDPFGGKTAIAYDDFDLLVEQVTDAMGNVVKARNDYRVLQPDLVTDPNGNRSAVSFDVLGLVVGSAVMGKETGVNEGDSLEGFEPDLDDAAILAHVENPFANPHAVLGKASSRLIYDLFRYQKTSGSSNPQPSVVYSLGRETHAADLHIGELTSIQHRFTYSDGFGREIQRKIQAEPGDVDGIFAEKRWVGSGWTIFNNKGKPVRQYEPFFSDTHRFQFAKVEGVSPILFYDPLERVIATLHPNHTYGKVVFDPWRQETWDVNDTVHLTDPKLDPDVEDFFRRLPDVDYLPSWYEARKDGLFGPDAISSAAEKHAAEKAFEHRATPGVVHFDSLGRPFLSIADVGSDGQYETRMELDIESNTRTVIDHLGRAVMRYDYDLLGTAVHSKSMDAGERWTLLDVAGKPIHRWDSRGFELQSTYDELQRPTNLILRDGGGFKALVERTVYGESHPNPENANLRGRVFQQYDNAGIVTNEILDFKGNLLGVTRQLTVDYDAVPDWSANPALEQQVFRTSTIYDALNRPTTITTPDDSVILPTYSEANLLEHLKVYLKGANTPTIFVNDIDYNAKGQREFIEYGDGNVARTTYEYDPLTFRLTHLQTAHKTNRLQDLFYTYDPVGNVTRIRDDAQQTLFFDNAKIEPHADYTYDAIYRLTKAEGREHIGQTGTTLSALKPHYDHDDATRTGLVHPNEIGTMRRYTEHYLYDAVGNILQMIHSANGGNWTRHCEYAAANNHLMSSSLPNDSEIPPYLGKYTYDDHGNMISMPHLANIEWDFKDQIQWADLGGGGTAHYVYDGAGQRVRKVWKKSAGPTEEHIYLGGFEIFRQWDANGTMTLKRETLHITDDTQRVALVETRTEGDDGSAPQLIRYQFGNHLGSASLELNDHGDIIFYEEYYPYGSTSYQAVNKAIIAAAKRYRYTGKERDEETGLYYHGARYYASWLGRWTSADPAGMVDGVNVFAYVKGNPIVLTDPSGTQTVEEMARSPHGVRIVGVGGRDWGMELDAPPAGSYIIRPGMGRISTSAKPKSRSASKPSTPKKEAMQAEAPRKEKALSTSEYTEILQMTQPRYRYQEKTERLFAAIRLGGAALEGVGAALLLLAPEPTLGTKAGGLFLAYHAADTGSLAIVTMWTGKPTPTLTYELFSSASSKLGADPQLAHALGSAGNTTADVAAAGVSLSVMYRPLRLPDPTQRYPTSGFPPESHGSMTPGEKGYFSFASERYGIRIGNATEPFGSYWVLEGETGDLLQAMDFAEQLASKGRVSLSHEFAIRPTWSRVETVWVVKMPPTPTIIGPIGRQGLLPGGGMQQIIPRSNLQVVAGFPIGDF